MSDAPDALNKITDVVLAYRPKSKTKKARKVKAARRKKSKVKKRD